MATPPTQPSVHKGRGRPESTVERCIRPRWLGRPRHRHDWPGGALSPPPGTVRRPMVQIDPGFALALAALVAATAAVAWWGRLGTARATATAAIRAAIQPPVVSLVIVAGL